GETIAVNGVLTSARTFAASALQSLAVRLASWKTSAFWRNMSECRPDDRMKCPRSRAPAFSNSLRTCSEFMGIGFDVAASLLEQSARNQNAVSRPNLAFGAGSRAHVPSLQHDQPLRRP